MAKFLDSNGLLYLWSKIKAALPTKTSQLTNDSGFITTGDIPEGAAASTTTPKMDGTAAVGSELAFARGDHIHPTDTSRQAKLSASNKLPASYVSGLAGVATSGSYVDLSNKPPIPSSAADVGAVAESKIGAASGVCPLGADALVPNQYLPSYVDDVIEAYIVGSTALASGWLSKTAGGAALAPETGKIYVILTDGDYLNKTYRWGGSTYVQTNPVDISAITNAEIDSIVSA